MEKEVKLAVLVDEDGVEYELEIVKEFDYKDKKYAVLYEGNCSCNEECCCEEDDEDEEHDCEENDNDDCECGSNCDCHEDDEECDGHIYVFEVVRDEEGKEVYNEVDPGLMEELIPIVEKELYPTEE